MKILVKLIILDTRTSGELGIYKVTFVNANILVKIVAAVISCANQLLITIQCSGNLVTLILFITT